MSSGQPIWPGISGSMSRVWPDSSSWTSVNAMESAAPPPPQGQDQGPVRAHDQRIALELSADGLTQGRGRRDAGRRQRLLADLLQLELGGEASQAGRPVQVE